MHAIADRGNVRSLSAGTQSDIEIVIVNNFGHPRAHFQDIQLDVDADLLQAVLHHDSGILEVAGIKGC